MALCQRGGSYQKSGLIPNEIENIQSKSYKTSCGQLPTTFSPSFCFAAFGLLELKIFPGC